MNRIATLQNKYFLKSGRKGEQINPQWAGGGKTTIKTKHLLGFTFLNVATFDILGKVFFLGLIKTETSYE